MKQTLVFTLILWAVSLSAQRYTISDSSWVFNQSGKFFSERVIIYNTGEKSDVTTLLGDTAAVVSAKVSEITSSAQAMATDVEFTSSYTERVRGIIRDDAQTKAITGKSAINEILLPVRQALIDSTYKVKVSGVVRNISFSVSAHGVFRYRIDNLTIRQCDYMGSIMRLNNWLDGGKPLDLYKMRTGRWVNLDRTVQLYLQSMGPQSNSTSQ